MWLTSWLFGIKKTDGCLCFIKKNCIFHNHCLVSRKRVCLLTNFGLFSEQSSTIIYRDNHHKVMVMYKSWSKLVGDLMCRITFYRAKCVPHGTPAIFLWLKLSWHLSIGNILCNFLVKKHRHLLVFKDSEKVIKFDLPYIISF